VGAACAEAGTNRRGSAPKGVTEETSRYRHVEGKWSLREVLAHHRAIVKAQYL